MLGAWGVGRSSSRLRVWKRRLLGAVALGALPLPGVLTSPGPAWGQISETLPEVTVSAPRPKPRPPRRAEPAPRRTASSAPATREPAPAVPEPAPAVTAPSPFQFVAPTPITGLGIDRNKVPAMVQTLPAEDFSRVYSPNVVETFVQRIPGVSTNNVQGNEFATDLRYRGFAASPLQGTPQGLAVYMQGIRVNEAFGDTVNWDLIPKVAIGRADIWTNNPTFGLNALGGAISFQMKDGFTYNGTEFDASGGSYGRVGGSLQYGVRNGEWGLYLAAEGLKDDGWRLQSPSRLARFYGDLGWKGTDAEIHMVTSAADNFFGVIGPTPIELLANDYRAIYTWPQTTKNEAALVALNGRYSVTDHWTVQSNLYYRRFNQQHVDGNAAEIERCSGAANNPLFNTLCLQDDAFPQPRPPAADFQILNQNGQPINCPPGGGNTCATTPWGTVDRTFTKALTTGASLQAPQRRQGARSRQQLRDWRQRRSQQDRLQGQQRAWLYLSRSLRRSQRRCAGDGRDHSHRGQSRLQPGQPRCVADLLWCLLQRNVRFDQPAVADSRGPLQPRRHRHGRSVRHQPRPQRQLHLRPFQSSDGLDLQNSPGADDVLCRILGSEPYTDAARARLLQSFEAVLAGRVSGIGSATSTSGCPYARGRTTRQHQYRRRSRRLEARTVSHRQPERHHPGRERAPGPRRVPERARHPPPRAGGGRAVPDRPISRLCQLRLHRCHLPVLRKAGVAEQSFRGRRRKYLRHARQADSRHSAASDQRWR